MKANKKMLIILLILLVILIPALLFLLQDQKKEEAQEETAVQEGEERILTGAEENEIRAIRIENPDGIVEIVREENGLVLKGFEKYAQSQVQLQVLVRNLAGLTGTTVTDGKSDPGRYGLKAPKTTVTISGKDETILYLGDKNESANIWYLMKEGDDTLYTVPAGKGNLMNQSPYTYLDATFIAPYGTGENITERLTHIKVERPDLDAPLEIQTIDGEAQSYTSSYEIVSPVHVKTSYRAMNEEIGSLFGFAANQAVGTYDEKDADRYGFDAPVMVMTVDHDKETDVFTVGGQAEDGTRYLIWDKTDLLYVIGESSLTFLNTDVNDLFFGIALLPEIDTVSEVELEIDGETNVFVLERRDGAIDRIMMKSETKDQDKAAKAAESEADQGMAEKAAKAGTDQKTEEKVSEAGADQKTTEKVSEAGADQKTTEKVSEAGADQDTDGQRELDEKQFRRFFSFLLEVDVEKVDTDEKDGKKRLGITYRYLDGSEDTLESYVLEDGRTAAVFVNGTMSFTGRIAYVEKLKTELDHLLAGEAVDTNW